MEQTIPFFIADSAVLNEDSGVVLGGKQGAALAAALELLEGMGFGDRARTEALLRRHGNDVQVRRFDHWSNDGRISACSPSTRPAEFANEENGDTAVCSAHVRISSSR